MQYFGRALALAWPQLLVGVLWLVVGLIALRYALATRRPIFLFSGMTALLLMLAEILSPARIAYHYFGHSLLCVTTTQCKVELLSGGYKYEQLLDGIAVVAFFVGLYLEVSRARRRAAANNATRAAASMATGASPAGGNAPADEFANQYPGEFAGQYQSAPQAQPITSYGTMPPDAYAPAQPEQFAAPAAAADHAPPFEDEQPTYYRRPASGAGPY